MALAPILNFLALLAIYMQIYSTHNAPSFLFAQITYINHLINHLINKRHVLEFEMRNPSFRLATAIGIPYRSSSSEKENGDA